MLNLKFCDYLFRKAVTKTDNYKLVEDNKVHHHIKNNKAVLDGISVTSDNDESRDAFVIATHPNDKNLSLLVLAEGVGNVPYPKEGRNDEMISSSEFAVNSIKSWFKKEGSGFINALDSKTTDSIKKRISKIDSYLRKSEGDNAVKLLTAIVTQDYTYILNVGDLRCYIGQGLDINQINEVDSDLWDYYRRNYFSDKEEFRFDKRKDDNIKYLGREADGFTSSYIISNDVYDNLYLFSRGVIDCVSEGKLVGINSDLDVSTKAKKIIDIATDGKTETMKNYYGYLDEFVPVTHGKRNATTCVYAKIK